MEHPEGIHPGILHTIRRLTRSGADGGVNHQQNTMNKLCLAYKHGVNRQSIEYLVDFLHGDNTHQVTDLEFWHLSLYRPSDGGLNVLIDFFVNNQTTTSLSKVKLAYCIFGSAQETMQLIAALQSNRLITDLTICHVNNLAGVALVNCISGVLQNAIHLQRLELGRRLDTQVIRAFQPGLRSNRNLRELCLSCCRLEDDGLHLIVDALVGNTTMGILDISGNVISYMSIVDITRLLELTRIKNLNVSRNLIMTNQGNQEIQRFASALSRNNTLQNLNITVSSATAAAIMFQGLERNMVLEHLSLTQYPGLAVIYVQVFAQLLERLPLMKGIRTLKVGREFCTLCLEHAAFLPALRQNTSLEVLAVTNVIHGRSAICVNSFPQHREEIVAANIILARNCSLRHADLLFALQPRTNMPIASKSGIWYTAMAKFAVHGLLNHDEEDDDEEEVDDDNGPAVSGNPGASAIFKILQRRPTIVGKQVQRPTSITSSLHHHPPPPDNTNIKGHDSTKESLETEPARKRRRL